MLPQYHLVFDDMFETGLALAIMLSDDICNPLFDSNCDVCFYEDKFPSDDPFVHHLPPLDEVWLSEPECNTHC